MFVPKITCKGETQVLLLINLEIPGPTDLRTGFYNETAMAIFWTRRFGVKKTSGFQVIWQEEETDSAQSLNTTFTTVVLSDLNPGSRYEVKVQSIQEENIFGKLSNASLFFTRTSEFLCLNYEVFTFVNEKTLCRSKPKPKTTSFSTSYSEP